MMALISSGRTRSPLFSAWTRASAFKALSKGYQSIFKLTVALALDVPYVIFDEPVLGLDANNRELFYKLLLEKYEREGTR